MPIVGMGASAGGLEAFEHFFSNMPPKSGLAFVLVQHLDPTHESILANLLNRYTQMKVCQVVDGQEVLPNQVYVIPPNKDMALINGKLQLMEPTLPRGKRLPIDFFFRSLAKDQQEKAICIIFSGTGSDGTLGLKSVKGEGGMVMVQELESAKYDGMPRSAIATNMIDYITSPDKMPEQLLKYVNELELPDSKTATPTISRAGEAMDKIFLLLRYNSGHDFSKYKENTIGRRIQRRMTVNGLTQIKDYIQYLRQNPLETDTLFRELLIGVTNFFRDKEAFEVLENTVIPNLLENKKNNEPIRIWVAGCSTGEEAYSLAIILLEQMEKLDKAFEVQIFATDIDDLAIEKAREGIYPDSIVVDVSSERISKYFSKEENNIYQVSKKVRDMVIFAVQSIIKDPPFSKLDLLSCRNLLIYLGSELQKQILPLFHYALKPEGYMFLGSSETLGEFADLFTPIDKKWKLYQKTENDFRFHPPEYSVSELPEPGRIITDGFKGQQLNVRELAEQMLLEHYTPPSVIINERGDVLYVHRQVDKYLKVASGEATLNIIRMARDGLQMALTAAIRKVMLHRKPEIYRQLSINISGSNQMVNLAVIPVLKPASMQGLIMVTFDDMMSPPINKPNQPNQPNYDSELSLRMRELEQELKSTKEYLQTTTEELETSNEELKSTNEELQSANEELQSTNEELETSKEELQSVNEELVTVNSELQSKVDELTLSNNDLSNLFSSTQIGTVFLDLHLCVQRFTPSATKLVNLIDSDIGRPASHIVNNLKNDTLLADAKKVLDTLCTVEKEIQTNDGHWYWMRVIPYRTTENAIAGVVVTFSDLNEQKRNQQELMKLTVAVEQSPNMIMITDADGKIEYVNPQYSVVTGYTRQEVMGSNPRISKSGTHDDKFFSKMWHVIQTGQVWRGEIQNKKKNGQLYWESCIISPIKDDEGHITHFVAVKEDITKRKAQPDELEQQVEQRTAHLAKANEQYEQMFSNLPVMIARLDCDYRFKQVNRCFAQAHGQTPESLLDKQYFDLFDPEQIEAKKDLASVFDNVLNSERSYSSFAQPALYQPDDVERFWDWSVQPLKDDDGKVTGLLLSIVETTERETSTHLR